MLWNRKVVLFCPLSGVKVRLKLSRMATRWWWYRGDQSWECLPHLEAQRAPGRASRALKCLRLVFWYPSHMNFFSSHQGDLVHSKLLNETLGFIAVPFISAAPLLFNFSARTHLEEGGKKKKHFLSPWYISFSFFGINHDAQHCSGDFVYQGQLWAKHSCNQVILTWSTRSDDKKNKKNLHTGWLALTFYAKLLSKKLSMEAKWFIYFFFFFRKKTNLWLTNYIPFIVLWLLWGFSVDSSAADATIQPSDVPPLLPKHKDPPCEDKPLFPPFWFYSNNKKSDHFRSLPVLSALAARKCGVTMTGAFTNNGCFFQGAG